MRCAHAPAVRMAGCARIVERIFFAGFWISDPRVSAKHFHCECLAVVWATETLRTLLQGQTFILETDHDALRYLIQSKDAVGRLARWAMKLQQFNMVVKYRKGEENGAADYVSRLHQLPDGTY